MDGRIDVGEGELVGRDLAVGVHVPLAQQKEQLLLGELRVDLGEGDHVKRQVPRREPRILPFVGHGDDVAVVRCASRGSAASAARGRGRLRGVALEPILDE